MIQIMDHLSKLAVAKYGCVEISNDQLADLAGFNSEERELMHIFWDKMFNDSWIALTNELINTYLIDTPGPDALRNFYTRKLINKYQEDIDYQETTVEDPLFQDLNANPSGLTGGEQGPKRASSLKRYFKVTGRCLKDLIMSATSDRGARIRRYYIKVESLVVVMRDIITIQNKMIADKRVLDVQRSLAALTIKHKSLLKRRTYPKLGLARKGKCFYIIRNIKEEAGRYKIGISDNIDRRLKEHRTDIPFSKLIALYFTINNSEVERITKNRLQRLKLMSPVCHEFTCGIQRSTLLMIVETVLEAYLYEKVDQDILDAYNQEVLLGEEDLYEETAEADEEGENEDEDDADAENGVDVVEDEYVDPPEGQDPSDVV